MKTINLLIGKIRLWLVMRNITIQKTESDAIVSGFDNLKPEQGAMVQSLNSRSAGGFIKNLKLVMISGFDWFMSKFYSGYGHKSIADCASTSISIDGMSMLAAKAIQDWPLYNGQETSTRYIDTLKLGYVNPVDSLKGKIIMEKWFDFYKKSLNPLIEHLKIVYPKKENQNEKKWLDTIEKRAYDILGSFLPAGARTNASIHMTLRQFDDKLDWLIHNPLGEVSSTGETILSILEEKYPATFIKEKHYPEQEKYRKDFMYENYYVDISKNQKSIDYLIRSKSHVLIEKNFQHDWLIERYRKQVEERPIKTELPKILNQCGSYRMEFLIDYRSHRDMQRQRSATQETPLLTMELGFEEWYLKQMPIEMRKEAELLICSQQIDIENLTENPLVRQYYIAMGFRVFDAFTISLADMVYIIELRTPTTVHPTARRIARLSYKDLKEILPNWFKIYADLREDDFDTKRADQDILIQGKSFSKM